MRHIKDGGYTINQLFFMQIFKLYGVNLPLENQQDLFNFLAIEAPKNFFNLQMLAKLLHIVVKLKFKTLIEKNKLIEPA